MILLNLYSYFQIKGLNLLFQNLFLFYNIAYKTITIFIKMQGNTINSNLLRKSYGFQVQELPPFKNYPNRINPSTNNNNNPQQTQPEMYNTNIKQMENKL
jgi:hypothetical protein